jgi:predicted enzyme related to lactoylglutathione lyase
MADVPVLYRLILQVSDLDKASQFYAKLFNTDGRRVRGGRHYFDCGPVILALLDVAAGGEEATPTPDYIYFSVENLEAVHVRARELGCLSQEKVHDESAGEIVTRPWGERSFYVADPFGNLLCFVDEQTKFTGR